MRRVLTAWRGICAYMRRQRSVPVPQTGFAVEVVKAGCKLHRVLPDGGNEFKGEFGEACDESDIRHRGTKPTMRVPTGSLNDSRARGSCMSTGGSSSDDSTSPAATNYRQRWMDSFSSTIPSGRIKATAPESVLSRKSPGASQIYPGPRRPEVPTPLQNRTCYCFASLDLLQAWRTWLGVAHNARLSLMYRRTSS